MKRITLAILSVVALVLIAYHLLIAYDHNFKYGRMWETPAVRPHERPLLVMEPGTVPVDGGEMIYRTADPSTLRSPVPRGDPSQIARGEKGYFTFCAQCHGKHHDGNGTVGQSFYPLPADLRSRKVQGASEGALFQEISYGIPGGRQPALATTIEITERWQITAYIQSLGIRPSPTK